MLHVMGYPARAENIPQILLRRLFSEGSFCHGKKVTKTVKAETIPDSLTGGAGEAYRGRSRRQ